MPRSPIWNIRESEKPSENTQIPPWMTERCIEILQDHPRERIDAFLRGADEAASKYFAVASNQSREPFPSQKAQAAKHLSRQARKIVDRLPACGGADFALHRELAARGFNAGFITDLEEKLEVFAQCCESASTTESHLYVLKKPETVLSSDLARYFAANFRTKPSPTSNRGLCVSHPFLQVLKLILNFCTGISHTDHAVEPYARKGIQDSGAAIFY